MKQALIFSGTTEGRELAQLLAEAGISCEVCVATEYGEFVTEPAQNIRIHRGRMGEAEMRKQMERVPYFAVVDATHPYAVEVSEHIRTSAEKAKLRYLRLKRRTDCFGEGVNCRIYYAADHRAGAKILAGWEGNILLTTGSKELEPYIAEGLRERLFVRVLPGEESIKKCREHGIFGKQVIAMQGPFSAELNEALIRQYKIACLVTKESGNAGGFREKLLAAERTDIPVIVLGNPDRTEGVSKEEVLSELSELSGVNLRRMQISLVGTGMGNKSLLTGEAAEAVRKADYLFGADRLLKAAETINRRAKRMPSYLPEEILPRLEEINRSACGKKAAVLFSGDTGFYSGAKKMYAALLEAQEKGMLAARLKICPGISSVSYLAAKAGTSWEDAGIYSVHGRRANLAEKIRTHEKVFLLLSGCSDLNELGKLLEEQGLSGVKLTVGFQLSAPEEEIMCLTPEECKMRTGEGLYTCLLENRAAGKRILTPGLPDAGFCRGKVPMTKEEVREVSLCKLGLHKDAVLYDVGSGTGSVAVEAARLSDSIFVYAVEKKEAAQALIESNRRKFGLCNIKVIAGEAPEALLPLPALTHAFIGGSGGNLREILWELYRKNNTARVVLNAISLETIAKITALCGELPVCRSEIVQLQVSRAKKAGVYHLMEAENPIYIVTLQFGTKTHTEGGDFS